jgi:hypothetical protein
LIDAGNVGERIFVIRGLKVILDSDLAALYGASTKRFNEQVRRNANRFPADFAFRLTNQEVEILRSQIATSSWGGRRYLPLVFTEHGAIMAAAILNTPRAIEVSVFVVRAFVELREAGIRYKELTKRLDELEASIEKKLATQDQAISNILSDMRSLMKSPDPHRRPIGFVTPDE